MAAADKLAMSGWLNEVETAIWPTLKPKIANWLYAQIEANPDVVVWTKKGSFWRIPYSITIKASELQAAIGFLLGPDTRSSQPALVP